VKLSDDNVLVVLTDTGCHKWDVDRQVHILFFYISGGKVLGPKFYLAIVQGCQIFFGKTYQNGGNIPNDLKIYPLAIKLPNCYKIFQMTIRIIHQHFPFQGQPKYFGMKYTIWQLWFRDYIDSIQKLRSNT
jgi:hypothetical protein